MRKANLIGQRFGRLVVIEEVERKGTNAQWLCKCDCGNEVKAITARLKNGHVKSCGCLSREITSKTKKTHGESKTKIYEVWCHMKARCYYPQTLNFHRWGGRGIRVCDDWKESFESFKNWAIENGYQDNLTLDRIDLNGNYEPQNCRWISRKEQSRNRSTNVVINGKCLAEWAEIAGISLKLLHWRLKAGWDFEKAINTPVRQQKRI